MRDAAKNSDICELYTEGSHHRNLCLFVTKYLPSWQRKPNHEFKYPVFGFV